MKSRNDVVILEYYVLKNTDDADIPLYKLDVYFWMCGGSL